MNSKNGLVPLGLGILDHDESIKQLLAALHSTSTEKPVARPLVVLGDPPWIHSTRPKVAWAHGGNSGVRNATDEEVAKLLSSFPYKERAEEVGKLMKAIIEGVGPDLWIVYQQLALALLPYDRDAAIKIHNLRTRGSDDEGTRVQDT